MLFHTLEIISQPKIEFACSILENMTPDSRNIIDHRHGMIEFGIHLGADIQVESETRTYIQHDGDINIYFPDEKYILTPLISTPTDTQLNSVSVFIPQMHLERKLTATEAEAAHLIDDLPPGTIILPETISLPPDDTNVFISTLRSLINSRLEQTTAGHLRCLSLWYELTAELDSALRSQIYSKLEKTGQTPSSSYYHAYRIKRYISDHISDPLSVSKIAQAIGLSPDYAGRIFHRECGTTITEHITRSRVSLLRSLISSNPSAPLADLAAQAGFSDLRYAQRIFKQKTGSTMQRCRQLDSGITLWHPDPWQTPDLTTDLYQRRAAAGIVKDSDYVG